MKNLVVHLEDWKDVTLVILLVDWMDSLDSNLVERMDDQMDKTKVP